MRILAIRGANLASLAAPFEVDFARPPLADVGLFAITGPTGSGKSTILDALCLALFDQVPRLPAGRGVAIGRASDETALRIGSNDVRSVLRRGAGEGFAEVDFVGSDARRYRARWDVRRARRKADGRLQVQQLGLTCLDTGEAIGHTKTEVLHEISDRLGLSFDQFRRSVLLAQGDFAAFLKADSDERAGLLERITGTGLYSDLSKAAYRRATGEQNRLAQLQARLADIEPLEPGVRARLEKERRTLDESIRGTETEREHLRQIVEWHERHHALRAAAADARDAADKSQAAWEASAGRRHFLDQVEQAQPLRTRLDAFRAADAALAEAEARLATARAGRDAASRAVEEARAHHETTARQLAAMRQEREDNRARLNEVRQLDTRLETAARQLEDAALRASTLIAVAGRADDRVGGLGKSHDAATRELDQSSAWLREHRVCEPLAAEWGRWEEALGRYARRRQEADQVGAECAHHEQSLEGTRARLAEAQAAQQAAEDRVRDMISALEAVESRASALPTEDLRRERAQLDGEREGLREARRLSEEAKRLVAGIEERTRRLEAAKAAEIAEAAILGELAVQLPVKAAQLEEASRGLDLALASRDDHVKHLRSLLESGSPCPVCGATEHPWAGQEVVFDVQVQGLRERKAQLEADQRALQQRQATAEAQRRQAGETVRRLGPELEADRDHQQVLARTWDGITLADKPVLALSDPQLTAALADRLLAVDTRRTTLAEKEQEADALARGTAHARRALDEAREAVQAAVMQVHDAERTRQEHEAQLREATTRGESLGRELESIADMLARPLAFLADWRDALDGDAGRLVERGAAWAHLWADNTGRRDAARETLAELEKELAEARTEARAARAAADEAERARSAADGALADLRETRAGYFEGRAVEAVEHALDAAVDATEVEDRRAGQALSGAQRTASAAEQAVVAAEAEVERRQVERQAAQRHLDTALAGAGIDRALLEQRLQHDAQWIAAEKTAIDALRKNRDTAATVLQERTRLLADHETVLPGHDRDDAAAKLEALGTQIEDQRNQLADRVARLRQDDDRRSQAATLAGEAEQQRGRVGTWSALNDLIGSADGKKFRVFAQSLTLEALLAHANEHLQDLSRRYRLQRVPASDLELQVIDTEMGDEVRSVHSLSGGESFLVSLALALGLASLSSQTAQVESLFIDEGFGSLDQDALDMAIASLDTLQSLGRKVGVISHVPTLVERIGTRIRVVPQGGGRSVVEVTQG